jgi:hypothetical protein
MEEQLFRFSVLRAPEPASDLSPIIVRSFQDQQPADQLVPVVLAAVTWLKSKANTPESTVGDLRAALDARPMEAALLSGVVALGKQQFVRNIQSTAADATAAARRELAGSGEFLTAAVLLSELAVLEDE